MIRRILSLVIALVASVIGYFALWTGGTALTFAAGSFRNTPLDLGAVALVLLGVILIAVAALTVAISSLGVIVVGAFHLLVGLVSILSPVQLIAVSPITYQIANGLFGRNEQLNYGFYASVPTGVGATVGVVLLVAGLVARGRTGLTSSAWRIVSPIIAVIFGIGGLVLVLSQGYLVYSSQFQRGSWDTNPVIVSLLLLGLVLIAVAVLTVRWSSAGVLVVGLILTAGGLFTLFQPQALPMALVSISRELPQASLMWSSNGSFLLVGVVLLAVGFGARTRARRRPISTVAPAQAPIPGPYGTVAT